MENKQIALLDLNVLSSPGANGCFWQGFSGPILGIHLQSGVGNKFDVTAFSCCKVQKQIVGSNHSDFLCSGLI